MVSEQFSALSQPGLNYTLNISKFFHDLPLTRYFSHVMAADILKLPVHFSVQFSSYF